jgi:tetratricopeptide (TPR) repeat protein
MKLFEPHIFSSVLTALASVAILICFFSAAAKEIETVTSQSFETTERTGSLKKTLANDPQQTFARYAGSESCRDCHAEEYALWEKSNHGLAERPVQPERDRAAFDPPQTFRHGTQTSTASWSNGVAIVTAIGLSRKPEAHAVARVIGNDPLRQFLIPFPGGRFQTLEASYDPRSNQWFNVYGNDDRQPGEWGHWTGRGMNWNSACAECHNTRLQKNYDEKSDSFQTAMAEISVGCEACHGPLRAHNEWQKKFGRTAAKDPTITKFTRDKTVDNCGFCHSLRADLTGDFKPGDNFSDDCELLKVDAGERYYADGQIRGEDYEYGSFLSSKMHAAGVACMDCHNPHSGKTILPGNLLCLRCHGGGNSKAPVIDPVAHSHHQVRGCGADGKPVATDPSKFAAKDFPQSGGECVNCHMPQTVYMQRHARHDHGFTSPDPLLTKQFGIPNACNRCHQDKDADWSLKFCNDWFGAKMERPARQRAQVIASVQSGDLPSPDDLLAQLKKEGSTYWRAVESDLLLPWAAQPEVAEALLQGLQDTNALVRAAAARSLETALAAGMPDAPAALEARLDDPSRNVRIAAAWSLRATLDTNSPGGIELRQYLAFNADEPIGQLNLGNYFYARNDLESAARHFQKAVAWDVRSAPFHQSLAVVLSALNRPQEAVKTLEQAVHFSPDDAESHYELGLAYNGIGNLTNSLAQLAAAVRLEPRHVLAWYNLGLAQNACGKTDAAIASLSRAESLAPADAKIPFAQATILARLGRNNEAIQKLERALEMDPGAADARKLLQTLLKLNPAQNRMRQ